MARRKSETPDMLKAALDYAAAGFAVFPCHPNKAPATVNGFKDATDDEDTIRAWWAESPNALIGMPIPDGFVVVDIDPRNGGTESLEELKAEGKTLPLTKRAKTGSGGSHRWYAMDTSDRPRGKLAKGIDIKTPGRGYVIVPPSESDAGTYEWVRDGRIADAPPWLVGDLRRPEWEASAGREAVIPPFMDGTTYGLRALELELAELADAKAGERNNALNKSAFSLAQLVAGGELRQEPVYAALEEQGEALGLDPHEIEVTLASAFDAGLSEPRNAPELTDQSNVLGSASGRLRELRVAQNEQSGGFDQQHFWLDWDEDAPEEEYVLEPFWPRHAYVLVYGATEAAKSMVMMGLAARASCAGVRTSYYSLENPARVDRQRLKRWHPCKDNFRLTNQLLNLANPEEVVELAEREAAWRTDVVIIDTYSHAYAPRFDSGDGNAKAIETARVIRWLMQETGATFVMIDHTGFPKEGARDVIEPRDASAKRQQVDVAIYMEREGEWERGMDRAHFRMQNFKSARFDNPFNVNATVWGRSDEDLRLGFHPRVLDDYPQLGELFGDE